MKPKKSCVTIRLSCKIVLFSSVVWLSLYFFGKEGIKILILNHKYQVSWFYCETQCLLTFFSLNQRFPLILRLSHGLLLEDCISWKIITNLDLENINCMLLSSHVRSRNILSRMCQSESTLYTCHEYQGTSGVKQAQYLRFKLQQLDSNPLSLSS